MGATVLDVTIETPTRSFHFDALQRVEEKSDLGRFGYMPFLIAREETVQGHHRLLLGFGAVVLGSLQKCFPVVGMVIHGPDCKRTEVKIEPHRRKLSRLLDSLQEIADGRSSPPPILNDYCRYCPFCRQCTGKALADEDLSLLDRMKEKDVARFHRKVTLQITVYHKRIDASRPIGVRADPLHPNSDRCCSPFALLAWSTRPNSLISCCRALSSKPCFVLSFRIGNPIPTLATGFQDANVAT